jgi:hypothetical protein
MKEDFVFWKEKVCDILKEYLEELKRNKIEIKNLKNDILTEKENYEKER